MINNSLVRRKLTALTAFALPLSMAVGCGLEEQSAPPIGGPSEFGLSLSLAASPEVLMHDGRSESVITATARDEAGRPVPNVTVRWDGTASSSRAMPVTLNTTASATDGSGRATVVLTAPPAPTETPASPDSITILATPASGASTSVAPRSIIVRLRPAQELPARNNNPAASFSVTPAIPVVGEVVTFNAQNTTDEGEPCLTRCTYQWQFGDGSTATGMVVTHAYARPAMGSSPAVSMTFPVTLTVTDERGGVGSSSQDVVVRAGAEPTAVFTVNPERPTAGNSATFDASGSTASNSFIITTYSWNWGDGTLVVSNANSRAEHAFASGGTYIVTLTVTDSGGRADQEFKSITVQ